MLIFAEEVAQAGHRVFQGVFPGQEYHPKMLLVVDIEGRSLDQQDLFLEQQIKHLRQTDGVMMVVTLVMDLLVQVVVDPVLEVVPHQVITLAVPVVLEQNIQSVDLL